MMREGDLVRLLGKVAAVAARRRDQPFAVHEEAPAHRLFVRQPEPLLQAHRDELADAHARLTRAVEQERLVAELGHVRQPRRAEQPRQRDARRALDVVVEAGLLRAERLQQAERVLVSEILELHQAARLPRPHFRHELFHQRVVRVAAQTPPAQPAVRRVLEERLVVGADVQAHGKALLRVDARAHGVEQDFALRDGHAAGAKVAQPQDALAVRHHGDFQAVAGGSIRGSIRRLGAPGRVDLQILRRARAQRGADGARVVRGDVDAARLDGQAVVRLARLAHRGRVHEGHDLHRVLHEQSVKRVGVFALQPAQEHVLIDGHGRGAERAERGWYARGEAMTRERTRRGVRGE